MKRSAEYIFTHKCVAFCINFGIFENMKNKNTYESLSMVYQIDTNTASDKVIFRICFLENIYELVRILKCSRAESES